MPVREPLSRCGALVIDSMPPATTILAEPALIASWASMIAFMPEPQTLLMVVQPACGGIPLARLACRAGAWPSPAGSTQPMMVSETWSAATPACSSAARIAAAPSVGVGTPVNWPRKEPMAVRLAPAMTTSDMGMLRSVMGLLACPNRPGSELPTDPQAGALAGIARLCAALLRCRKPYQRPEVASAKRWRMPRRRRADSLRR
jgi:hypothetical protein